MNLITCPNHPGRIIESHACPLCDHPAVPPEGREPYRALSLVRSYEQEARMDTATIDHPQIDTQTGEVFTQPTLSDDLFPAVHRDAVPMVKIGFSGTVEMTQEEFEAYCDEGLEPGRIVKITMTGYLPNPHAKWVKRREKVSSRFNETSQDFEGGGWRTWWEQEGAVKVKALELGRFELGGIYDEE